MSTTTTESMQIFVKYYGAGIAQTIAVDITDRAWGWDIQALIENHFGLPMKHQRLVFAGKELSDLLPMTLAWGVKKGDTIECFLRASGGSCECCGQQSQE